jgi:hypothetical protein
MFSFNPFSSTKQQPTVTPIYTQKQSKVSNILPKVSNIFGTTNSTMKNNSSMKNNSTMKNNSSSTSLNITNYPNNNLNSKVIAIGAPNKSRVQNIFTSMSMNATQRKMNNRRKHSKVSNILPKVGGTRKNYRKKSRKSRKNRKQSRKTHRK